MDTIKDMMNLFIQDLYTNYKVYLTVVINNSILNKNDSEEILQEVFILVAIKYDIIKNHPNIKAWLTTTTHFIIYNYNRKMILRNKYIENILDYENLEVSIELQRNNPKDDLENFVIEKIRYNSFITQNILQKAFEKLSRKERELFILRFVEKKTVQELKEILGNNRFVINSKLYKIKKKISNFIYDYGNNHSD